MQGLSPHAMSCGEATGVTRLQERPQLEQVADLGIHAELARGPGATEVQFSVDHVYKRVRRGGHAQGCRRKCSGVHFLNVVHVPAVESAGEGEIDIGNEYGDGAVRDLASRGVVHIVEHRRQSGDGVANSLCLGHDGLPPAPVGACWGRYLSPSR